MFGGKPLQGHSIPEVYGAIEATGVFVPLQSILGSPEAFKTATTEVFGPLQVRLAALRLLLGRAGCELSRCLVQHVLCCLAAHDQPLQGCCRPHIARSPASLSRGTGLDMSCSGSRARAGGHRVRRRRAGADPGPDGAHGAPPDSGHRVKRHALCQQGGPGRTAASCAALTRRITAAVQWPAAGLPCMPAQLAAAICLVSSQAAGCLGTRSACRLWLGLLT